MKAPFLGRNNGRYVAQAVEHGLPARLDVGARGDVVMTSNGALMTARRIGDKVSYQPTPRAGRIEWVKEVTFYSPKHQKMVTIEVKAHVDQKRVDDEPDRVLCAVPGREKPQSRNSQHRTYHWAGNYAQSMVKGSVGRAKLKVERKVGQVNYPEWHKVKAARDDWQGGGQ